MLGQLFKTARKVLAQLVENVGTRDVTADIGHSRQGHSMESGFSGDFFHRHDSPEAKRSISAEFFQSVADHRDTRLDE